MADKKSLVNVDFGGSSSIKNLPSATPAASDCLAITDESDGGKVKKGPAIGSNDGTFLRHDGSWATPSGGGTTKYTHNIVLYWNGGSGDDYRQGSLSFSFQDTNPNSYATNGYTEDESDVRDFFATHCNLTSGKKYPVNGTVQMGALSGDHDICFITNVTNPGFELWYIGGAEISFYDDNMVQFASAYNEEINYLSVLIGNQNARIYDTVV